MRLGLSLLCYITSPRRHLYACTFHHIQLCLINIQNRRQCDAMRWCRSDATMLMTKRWWWWWFESNATNTFRLLLSEVSNSEGNKNSFRRKTIEMTQPTDITDNNHVYIGCDSGFRAYDIRIYIQFVHSLIQFIFYYCSVVRMSFIHSFTFRRRRRLRLPTFILVCIHRRHSYDNIGCCAPCERKGQAASSATRDSGCARTQSLPFE